MLIDHSAFIGQFSIRHEVLRKTAKHKLLQIASREESEWMAAETFEENGYTDDTLWGLPNEVQDEFFPFMDRFHSLLKTEREPLQQPDVERSLQLTREFDCHLSNALTCAVAIRRASSEGQRVPRDRSAIPRRKEDRDPTAHSRKDCIVVGISVGCTAWNTFA